MKNESFVFVSLPEINSQYGNVRDFTVLINSTKVQKFFEAILKKEIEGEISVSNYYVSNENDYYTASLFTLEENWIPFLYRIKTFCQDHDLTICHNEPVLNKRLPEIEDLYIRYQSDRSLEFLHFHKINIIKAYIFNGDLEEALEKFKTELYDIE